LLFQEHEYGHGEYIDGLKKARKTVFDFYKKDSAYSIIDDRSAENGQVTSSITYQKGAWVLHMLRERIGHENFKKGIRNYYNKFINANATTNDFIEEMEKVSNEKLKTFFKQWLNKPGYLKLNVHWTFDETNKQLIFRLNQTQQQDVIFEAPIEFYVYEESSKTPQTVKFELNTRTAEFKIPFSRKPVLILADPRTALLADINLSENL